MITAVVFFMRPQSSVSFKRPSRSSNSAGISLRDTRRLVPYMDIDAFGPRCGGGIRLFGRQSPSQQPFRQDDPFSLARNRKTCESYTAPQVFGRRSHNTAVFLRILFAHPKERLTKGFRRSCLHGHKRWSSRIRNANPSIAPGVDEKYRRNCTHAGTSAPQATLCCLMFARRRTRKKSSGRQ